MIVILWFSYGITYRPRSAPATLILNPSHMIRVQQINKFTHVRLVGSAYLKRKYCMRAQLEKKKNETGSLKVIFEVKTYTYI